MYELIPVGQNTFYIDCPAKIGVYRCADSTVCLIDSGSDPGAAKKVIHHLEAQNWHLSKIFNTHSHADHVGGNALLQQRLGVPAYAVGMEVPFIQMPILESTVLFGAMPYREIRNKFLQAAPSDCRVLTEEVLPDGMEMTRLDGHAGSMAGFRTDDDVWFLADAVLSEETLRKYHVSYLFDVAGYLQTLDRVETMEGRLFIPSHAEPVADIRPLVAQNRAKAQEILELLLAICAEPRTGEQITQAVFAHYDLKMVHNQYATVGSTLRSYLSYLHDQKQLGINFSDNLMYWQRV